MVLGLAVVPMVNDTVAVTPVAAATTLDSTILGLPVRSASKIAGNTTFDTVSISVSDASNVEIVTPVVAADTAAAFVSPVNWQLTRTP